MSTTKAEKIDVAFKGGKVLVDIDLTSCVCTFDLTVGECVVSIEKLTNATVDASMALPGRR
jgi:hypothetical protein